MKKNKVEEFARNIIERELRQSVLIHDDGSEDSMYDLRIGSKDCPEVAIEVTGAVNKQFIEASILVGSPEVFEGLANDWLVGIRDDARIKTIRKKLCSLLGRLEEAGIYHLNDYWQHRQRYRDLMNELEQLGITATHRVAREDPTGKVYFILPGIGGGVDDAGTEIPQWISKFLKEENRRDNLYKLNRSGASECHVFVPISFSGAPFEVESYFSGDLKIVPQEAPDLPEPVKCVWLSGAGAKGIWWNGAEWKFFEIYQ